MNTCMSELSLEKLILVAGGNYENQLRELKDVIMKNRFLKADYEEFAAADDDLCDEDLLSMVLEGVSVKMDIVNNEIVYWDGKWTHADVMRFLWSIAAY